MRELFANVRRDADTKTIMSVVANIEGLNVLLEEWTWDGISGKTAIFLQHEISDITEIKLIEKLRSAVIVLDNFTVKRTADYLYLNYYFHVSE